MNYDKFTPLNRNSIIYEYDMDSDAYTDNIDVLIIDLSVLIGFGKTMFSKLPYLNNLAISGEVKV